jgi:integrase
MRRPEKKRNGTWQLRFTDAHGRMRYRTFPTRAAAEAFGKTVDAAKEAGGDPARRVRFNELVNEWRASHLAQGLRAASVKDYEQALKRLASAFGVRELRAITAADLERARNELVKRALAERTERFERLLARIRATPPEKRTEQHLATLGREPEIRASIARGGIRAAAKMVGCARTLWKFAVSRGYVVRNIAQDVKKPAVPSAVETNVIDQNILTPAEIERLIEHTPAEHRCALRFLFMTGVRLGELTGAMWSDMDWASLRIVIRRQRSGITGELTAPKTRAGTL